VRPAGTVFVTINFSDDGMLRELRRTMGVQFKEGSPSERMEGILALLIESGFLYCLLWVMLFCTAVGSALNRHMRTDILLVQCIQDTSWCRLVRPQYGHAFHRGALMRFSD
jgi:hypothetical protein